MLPPKGGIALTEGLCTEREWRRGGAGLHPAGRISWGPQCVWQTERRQKLQNRRRLLAAVILGGLLLCILMAFSLTGRREKPSFPMAAVPAGSTATAVRSVPGISFAIPAGLTLRRQTFIASELYRGRLLLLDEGHPLPLEASAVHLENIATFGKGMVPVSDLSLQSGRVTIEALTGLFQALRENGAGCFAVCRGTVPASGRTAAEAAGLHELLQEYTVELRMICPGSQQPDQRPLEETAQGRQLLRLAWRNGFIRTRPGGRGEAGFLFRYVGVAHATAMTYLDVDLPTYLQLLHEKKTMTVHGEGGRVFLIQCAPVTGSLAAFSLPADSACDVSMDNTGYAVAVCTIDRSRSAAQQPAMGE